MDSQAIMFLIGALWKSLDSDLAVQKQLIINILSNLRGLEINAEQQLDLVIDLGFINVVSFEDRLASEVLELTTDNHITFDQAPLVTIYDGELFLRDSFPNIQAIWETNNKVAIKDLILNLAEEFCHIRQIGSLDEQYFLFTVQLGSMGIKKKHLTEGERISLLETDVTRYFEDILDNEVFTDWIQNRILQGGIHEPIEDDEFVRIILKSFVNFDTIEDPELAGALR